MVLGIWIYDIIQIVGSSMVGQSAQGGGDAKLMAAIGAWFNWKFVLLSGAAAAVLALIVFLITAARAMVRGGGIKGGSNQLLQRQPLGPFIALGATIILFEEDRLVNIYQQFINSPYRDPCSLLLLIMLVALLFWTRRMRIQSY
jgi:leader peptidase (prepilin peptidase) / N-methyltransferase